MVNPEAVCNYTLHHWQDSATDDGHVEEPGSTARQRSEFGHSQAEDGGEHDGVEESEKQTRVAAAVAHRASKYPGLKRCNSPAPRNRPIIAPPQ